MKVYVAIKGVGDKCEVCGIFTEERLAKSAIVFSKQLDRRRPGRDPSPYRIEEWVLSPHFNPRDKHCPCPICDSGAEIMAVGVGNLLLEMMHMHACMALNTGCFPSRPANFETVHETYKRIQEGVLDPPPNSQSVVANL